VLLLRRAPGESLLLLPRPVLTSAGGNRHEISGLSKSSRRGTKFCLSRRCGILFCHAHLMRSRAQVAGDARTSFART
jgi:hypothetical protein